MWQWWIRVEKNLHIKATAYHLGLMVRAMLQPLALLTLLAAAAVRLNAWSIAYALSVGMLGRVSYTGSQPQTQARAAPQLTSRPAVATGTRSASASRSRARASRGSRRRTLPCATTTGRRGAARRARR